MNNDQFLMYLKSGAHRRPSIDRPIDLGPKTFTSQYAAYRYVKRMVLLQEPDVLFQGEDLAIILDIIKRHPNWHTLQRWTFIGFTVEPHSGSKMLTGLVPKVRGHGGRVDISIDRCFKNIEMSSVTKGVYRQDDVDWMIAA